MSTQEKQTLLGNKNEIDEEDALIQTIEEPNEEINDPFQDEIPMSKKYLIFPENYLFTKAKQDLLKPYLKGNDFSKHIRSAQRLPNYLQKYYIRVNIKRTFMNRYLLNALNKVIKNSGSITFFQKFPQSFANNMAKEKCKILMNMRLKEIFRTKELFEGIDHTNYEHNSKIVDEMEKKGKPELNMILNRKLCCLFEEYLYSEEFGKIELNRLKNLGDRINEYYLKKYVYLAKNFIKFCKN